MIEIHIDILIQYYKTDSNNFQELTCLCPHKAFASSCTVKSAKCKNVWYE